MSSINVINGGILTTIQDSGRYGYQELGIPTSGVMDDYNYRLANILVGNNLDEAVLVRNACCFYCESSSFLSNSRGYKNGKCTN